MALPFIARFAAGAFLRGQGSSNPSSASFTVRRTTDNIGRRTRQLEREFNNLKVKAHDKFVEVTPVDTGNARRNTDLRGNQIQANYDYSIRLEKEAHSRQAPRGMSEPTIEYIRNEIKKL
jgi:hypothetical protein